MKKPNNFDPDPMNAPYILCFECGGECYKRAVMYTWAKRVLGVFEDVPVCESCFEELFKELSLEEKAELIGSKKITVGEDVEA